MKKFFFFMTLLFASMTMFAETASIDLSAQGYENAAEITSVAIDANVAATFDKGTNTNTPKYYTSGTSVRLYGGSTLTISSTAGPITAINFTFGSSDKTNTISVDTGTLTDGAWTGESSTVVFTIDGTSGHRRFQVIEVTYSAAAEPVVEPLSFELNGGAAADFGWTDNQAMYTNLTNLVDAVRGSRTWLTYAEIQTAAAGNTFAGGTYGITAEQLTSIITSEEFVTKFTWLVKYTDMVAAAQGKAKPSEDGVGFRFSIDHFFANGAPYTNGLGADFTGIGVESEAWKPYFNFYTTPTKEGFEFTGWYTDEACTTLATALPEGGKLYAGWEKAAVAPTELWITPMYTMEPISAGDTLLLTLNYEPADATLGEITWEFVQGATLATIVPVENTNTAYLIANKDLTEGGQVSVKASAAGVVSETAYYTVAPAGPQGLSITAPWGTDINNLEIPVGGTLQLEAAFYPEDYVGTVIWESSNDELATVSTTGLVTSLVTDTEATVTITATAEGYPEIKASLEIKLLGATVVEPTTKTLYAKMTYDWWKADGAAMGCYYWGVEGAPAFPGTRMTPVEGEADLWSIEVPVAVTTVIFTRMAPDDTDENQNWGAQTADLVIPEGMNCYTITSAEATWGGGEGAVKGEWSVYPAPVPTELFVNPNYDEVKIGGTLQLKAIGDDEKEYPAVWTSNRADVLVSETGLVTVTDTATLGQAIITAAVTFGELTLRGQAYLAIIAADPVVTITAPASTTLAYGKTLQLAATTEPADAEAYWITWTTDNDQIATITTDGLLTAINPDGGVVKVIAGVEGYDATDTIEITCLPELRLNVYASGLKAGEVAEDKVEISYLLNARATALEVQLLAGETVVKTIAITDAALLTKGAHTTTIDLADVAGGTYTWAIKAAGKAIEAVTDVIDMSKGIYNFYLPGGVAVDNSPESAFFGRIYVTEATDDKGVNDGGSDRANSTNDGVYIYDALLEDVTNQGVKGYDGGITWSDKRYGPARIAVAANGELFIADYGDATTAGVYKMNPAAPAEPFKVVVNPASDPTYVDAPGLAVEGVGAERVLYSLQPSSGDTPASITARVIGDADAPYSGTPTVVADLSGANILNYDEALHTDGQGGFWGVQYRAQVDANPALFHVSKAGVVDFAVRTGDEWAADVAAVGGAGFSRGALALNVDKTLLAHCQDGKAVVFAIAYDAETGDPSLTKLYETPAIGGNVDGLAFDYAGNLYAITASKERLYAFATPKAENTCVTPAAAANTIIVPVKAPTDPQLNVYAYNLSSSVEDNQLTVKYALNAYAEEVTLLILDGEGAEVAVHSLGAKLAGAYDATVSLEDLAEGNYTWAIEAAGEARTEISAEILKMPNATYWQPRDMAFDKNPESPFFGQVYVTNSANGGGDAYVGNSTAIYVLNPLYELQGSYAGGVNWNTNNGPHRLYIDEAGLVYASNRSDTDGGIFIMDPANPEAPFKSLFDPAQRGVTYTKITGFDFAGEGADRVLVTADAVTYDSNLGSVGNILKYAIGECKENFAGAPDTLGTAAQYSLGNQHNQIAHDGRGGWWIAQNRGSEGGIQCLIHVTADGTRDYRSNTDGLGIAGSAAGALAVSDDYTLLAMAADNGIKVFAITWGEDGKPALELKYYTGSLANNMTGVDFDYAGNLLTGSLSSERLYAFALPSDNVKVTPAAKAYTIAVKKTETSLENADAEQVKVRKVFENGNVYIIRGGKKYTITGIVVE